MRRELCAQKTITHYRTRNTIMTTTITAGRFSLILGESSLNKEAGLIAKQATSLQERVHVAVLSALYHADAHGDSRPLARVVELLPDGIRQDRLIAWLGEYSQWDYKKA